MAIIFIYNNDLCAAARKELVEEYVNKVGVDNIDIKQLTKMYDYIADKMDKEAHEEERRLVLESTKESKRKIKQIYTSYKKPKNTETYKHINVLKNLEYGIKVNVSPNRNGHLVNCVLYDDVLEKANKQRVENMADTLGIINENMQSYIALRDYINTNTDKINTMLADNKIANTPHNIKMAINSDIAVCKSGLITNNVNINVYSFTTSDKLSTLDIDYSNRKFVKECIKELYFIKEKANKNINSTYMCIYMDIMNVLEKDIFTDKQLKVINKVINAEQFTSLSEYKVFEQSINKIVKHLNGN